MSKGQIDVALNGGDVDKQNRDVAFGMVKSSRYKWHNGVVPYVLSDSVSKWTLKTPSRCLSSIQLVPDIKYILNNALNNIKNFKILLQGLVVYGGY